MQGIGVEDKKEIINSLPYALSCKLITVTSSELKRFENV